MPELTPEQWVVVKKVLISSQIQYMIGAELEDVLSEDEDNILWTLINKLKEQ